MYVYPSGLVFQPDRADPVTAHSSSYLITHAAEFRRQTTREINLQMKIRAQNKIIKSAPKISRRE
jgi:hypothetical protein